MLRRFGCAFRVLRERGRRKGPGGCEDCAAEQNMARSLFYFRHVSLPHDYHFSAGVDPAFFVSKVSCFVSWRGKSLGCGAAPGQRRSEEQTYELQSLMRISYAVFCLKKKNTE